ncbi:hypothetical protein DFH08DRAFT_826835 [Mycena albidolilacea]|uniref:DUF6532 domain-containing protein n=1 Tax=Mycena albidolilacea TaxID=1033008 RepID=A0AAD6Z0D6_9AGAR|nr:hypothetical protein DFH08DRAFT_826835 [Mycena albidolilacea]
MKDRSLTLGIQESGTRGRHIHRLRQRRIRKDVVAKCIYGGRLFFGNAFLSSRSSGDNLDLGWEPRCAPYTEEQGLLESAFEKKNIEGDTRHPKNTWSNEYSGDKLVLRGGIKLLKTVLVIEDAYPSILSRAGLGKTYMLAATDNVLEAVHIKGRLSVDPKFAAMLSDILIDRVNIFRGAVKKVAVNIVPGHYKLAGLLPAETKQVVEDLLKEHRYIFPTDPVSIYAALVEYRLTGEHQNINFTEAAYEDTYRNHIKTLADTRTYAPVALHKVLHALYNDVTPELREIMVGNARKMPGKPLQIGGKGPKKANISNEPN